MVLLAGSSKIVEFRHCTVIIGFVGFSRASRVSRVSSVWVRVTLGLRLV